jgi:hypothetical protein
MGEGRFLVFSKLKCGIREGKNYFLLDYCGDFFFLKNVLPLIRLNVNNGQATLPNVTYLKNKYDIICADLKASFALSTCPSSSM